MLVADRDLAELDRLLRRIDELARPVSLATLGGFRPSDDPHASWMAGVGCGRADEEPPAVNGEVMVPILQINVAELPSVPDAMADLALVVVWMSEHFQFESGQFTGCDHDRYGGEYRSQYSGWAVREYASLDGLLPQIDRRKHPRRHDDRFGPRPYPVRWTRMDDEWPSLIDAAKQIPELRGWLRDPAFDTQIRERRDNQCMGTKVGGYPFTIQTGFDGMEDFVLQIDGDVKANIWWLGGGLAYFCRSSTGEWMVEVQND